MTGKLTALVSVCVGGLLGAIGHELSHMVIPAAFGADVGIGWRGGRVVGSPSVVVQSQTPLPAWAQITTALSPLVLIVGYAILAAFGVVPRRPWTADSPVDGAALAFLIVALPSPEDLRSVLNAVF